MNSYSQQLNFSNKFKNACINYNWKQLKIPFYILLACISTGVGISDDYYFLIENGKWIVENQALPFYDWMSMNDDLAIVMQQYPISILVYLTNYLGGLLGCKLFFALINFILFILIFKLTLIKSKNNYSCSYMLTILAGLFINGAFGSIRPQIFSCLFVILAIYILENYKTTQKKYLLYFLPLLSLVQCNFHSTFFFAVIGVYGIYFCIDHVMRMKDLKNINFLFLLMLLISLGTGFLNPYGVSACLQPFFTRGYIIYSTVTELKEMTGLSVILLMFSMIILFINSSKNKIIENIELFSLTIITCIFSLLCIRVLIFYIPIYAITLSSCFKKKENKVEESISKQQLNILTIICFVLLLISFIPMFDNRDAKSTTYFEDVKDYCVENNIDCKDKTLFPINGIEGQYMYHYLGMRPYIDSRIETYIDSLNHKYDYSTEHYLVVNGITNTEEFINKYNFDFLLLYKGDYFDREVSENETEKYNVIYENQMYRLWQKSDK